MLLPTFQLTEQNRGHEATNNSLSFGRTSLKTRAIWSTQSNVIYLIVSSLSKIHGFIQSTLGNRRSKATTFVKDVEPAKSVKYFLCNGTQSVNQVVYYTPLF